MAEQTDDRTATDWAGLLRRWDVQQEVYIEQRERRYEIMFELIDILRPKPTRFLDLMCGPGAISTRLLDRYPEASSVAVDVDPVLLRLGQGALGDVGGRLAWVRADISQPDWVAALPDGPPFDAVLTTTATHWLSGGQLTAVYTQLAGLLPEGALLLNGDHMPDTGQLPAITGAVKALAAGRLDRAVQCGAEDWDTWWIAVREDPAFAELLAERDRIFPPGRDRLCRPDGPLHLAAAGCAGFREASIVWRDLDDGLLLAVR